MEPITITGAITVAAIAFFFGTIRGRDAAHREDIEHSRKVMPENLRPRYGLASISDEQLAEWTVAAEKAARKAGVYQDDNAGIVNRPQTKESIWSDVLYYEAIQRQERRAWRASQ